MKVILEGDSLEVVQALQKEGSCWSIYGQFINDAKTLLHGGHSWEDRHVKRLANTAAHKLARMALVMGEDHMWSEIVFIPDCIHEIVYSD